MILRIARHTNRIKEITQFYTGVIGLEIIGQFENHDGYDGIFIGKKNLGWHLEFTTSATAAAHIFDEDDLLVFYPESVGEYQSILKSIALQKLEIHVPKNPYWRENGILVTDPDGFGIIISSLHIGN